MSLIVFKGAIIANTYVCFLYLLCIDGQYQGQLHTLQ